MARASFNVLPLQKDKWVSVALKRNHQKRRAVVPLRHASTFRYNGTCQVTSQTFKDTFILTFSWSIHSFSFVLRDTSNLFWTRYYTSTVICFFHEHCKFVQGYHSFLLIRSIFFSSYLIKKEKIVSKTSFVDLNCLTSGVTFLILSWHIYLVLKKNNRY